MDTDRPHASPSLRLAGIGAAIIALIIFALTSTTYVNPGHVGIIIHRTGGGVDQTPYGPGIHLRNPLTTGIQEYPTYMQTLVLTRSRMRAGEADTTEFLWRHDPSAYEAPLSPIPGRRSTSSRST